MHSSTCKTNYSHFIFIFSSDVYILIISERDVFLMHRKRHSKSFLPHFFLFLCVCGSLVEKLLLASDCKLSCIFFFNKIQHAGLYRGYFLPTNTTFYYPFYS